MCVKRYLKIQNVLIAVLSAFVLGSVCRLGVFYSIVLGMIIFLFLPFFKKYIEREKEAYFRFTQACLYMEQMENSFKKNRRIYPSLKETLVLFSEGEMKDTIQIAVDEIEKEDAAADAAEKALALVEEKYGCEQMELMHNFFLRSQEQGGDFTQAVGVLESRRNAWTDSVEQCRSEKRNMLFSVIMSFILLFVVSEAMMFFLPEEMNVMENVLERAAVVLEITLLLFMTRSVLKKNATDWLERIRERSAETVEKDYHFVEEYNPAKEMGTSIKWAVLPLGITVFLFLTKRSVVMLSIGLAVTVLLLNQHKLDFAMKKKWIKKEVERDFPRWMFHVILLLETESVQGAIYASMGRVPASLQYPVEKMWDEIQKNPTGSEPYFSFLKEYDVPKVQEAMKLLYSISSGTGGNVDEQMLTVIEKNNDMTLRSEKIKNDNRVAGMMGYLFLPVLPSGIKIMADLALVMMTMYSSLGSVL